MTTHPHPTTPLESFAKDLIREAQYKALEKEIEDEIMNDIMTRLNETITARVIANLTDQDIDSFNTLLDKNPSDTEIQKFVEEKIPESSNFLAVVLSDFRKTYLGLA